VKHATRQVRAFALGYGFGVRNVVFGLIVLSQIFKVWNWIRELKAAGFTGNDRKFFF
jgi:hypothetical protein